ncbi:glycosyltransferase family 4 protein [Nakamurella leprariae]|uniref:Glycosyltransferase family 4 protein n=1 Tax=Nakamurella leprariae TaxID=2803911 RepID=A0A939BVW0_9ACTN|nr:glycosyltransferase family 4 protein [Nakamurella leprariae]MBM9466928.1 glycosyltransferase family 4 protein [Nakamurella leprariae]
MSPQSAGSDRILLVTNDFPPRTGGIQSYVHRLAGLLPAGSLRVYAPAWPGAAEFDAHQPYPVHRHPTSLMLPVPSVHRRAAELIDEHRIGSVWFGAAAPLALLTPGLRRHGVRRVVASTHGHEVGWSMVPVGRQALRRIGSTVDVVTFVSRYARSRVAAAFGPQAALEYLPPGVDAQRFTPDPRARAAIRGRHGLGDAPVVVCVSRLVPRKGQDTLIRAMPALTAAVPEVRLLIVGDGRISGRLATLAERLGVADRVVFTGSVPAEELPAHYGAGDVFAMPCRTRGGGLDVEGLGIVFLEASAAELPVLAGNSGGAPETVRPGRTGEVVDGRDPGAVAQAAATVLRDPLRARRLGRAGRDWVSETWTWAASGDTLTRLLVGDGRGSGSG